MPVPGEGRCWDPQPCRDPRASGLRVISGACAPQGEFLAGRGLCVGKGVRREARAAWTLTLGSLGGVELLHRVVEPDADGGEAHLALQPGCQPAVEAAGSLRPHHGAQRPQNTPVLHGADGPGDPHLALDLWGANCITPPSAPSQAPPAAWQRWHGAIPTSPGAPFARGVSGSRRIVPAAAPWRCPGGRCTGQRCSRPAPR